MSERTGEPTGLTDITRGFDGSVHLEWVGAAESDREVFIGAQVRLTGFGHTVAATVLDYSVTRQWAEWPLSGLTGRLIFRADVSDFVEEPR